MAPLLLFAVPPRSRLLKLARSATRDNIDVNGDGGGAESKHSPLDEALSGTSPKQRELRKALSSLASHNREEERNVETMRVKLIKTVVHTVLLEAASNGMYVLQPRRCFHPYYWE
jgi:hypothetical protein